MGVEIDKTKFNKNDFQQFRNFLEKETSYLIDNIENKNIEPINKPTFGLEIEAWLTDKNFIPIAKSCEFLKQTNHELIVPEISKYNFEINSTPLTIDKNCFAKFTSELNVNWKHCCNHANEIDLNPIMIGTLPTLREHMVSLDIISPQKRYSALNSQIMKSRSNKAILVNINGRDEIFNSQYDVMMESAATSMQIHFQPKFENFKSYFNSSLLVSSLLVAASANSPYLYGKQLWSESRIPLFEQSVDSPCLGGFKRVCFGKSYLKESVVELFKENLLFFPPLLPIHQDSPISSLKHLNLHNGTVYRWNRPIVSSINGKLQFRIEQRSPASGPTLIDMQANIALYLGLLEYYANQDETPEELLNFSDCKNNFYQCSQWGFDAEVIWPGHGKVNVQKLLISLIPKVKEGLLSLKIPQNDIYKLIDSVIAPRLLNGINGANWQKAYVHTHGRRFQEMMESYYNYQSQNIPVHEWNV